MAAMNLARRALCIAVAVAGCTPFSGGASEDPPDASTDSGTSPDSSLAQEPAPPETLFAKDTFTRDATNGFGVAEVGGKWASRYSSPATMGVNGENGVLHLVKGVGVTGYLEDSPRVDVDERVTLQSPAFFASDTGGVYVGLVARWQAGAPGYVAQANIHAGAVTSLTVYRRAANGDPVDVMKRSTNIALSGTSPLEMRMQALGASPTRLRLKAWVASKDEPSAWVVDATDSSDLTLQQSGSVGVHAYLSSASSRDVDVAVDDFKAYTSGP